jgi:hypothetical protein
MRRLLAVWGVLVLVVACQAPVLADIVAASGLSTEADPAAAGKAAAEQAKKALGEKAAKLVLVFECFPRPDKAKVLEGVASVFDKGIVHGCSGEGPVTTHGNPTGKSCGLLAIGGDIEVAAGVTPKIGGQYTEAGEALANALPKMANAKLMVLFGNCHIPANKALVEGIQKVLGKELTIIGGAASGPSSDSFYQGEVKDDVAVGILIGGDVKVAAVSATGHKDAEEMIGSAVGATKGAVEGLQKLQAKPSVAFLFECRGRLDALKKTGKMSDELVALQEVLGKDLPLIGFYGSGEMGLEKGVCTGFGYHAVCCVIGK